MQEFSNLSWVPLMIGKLQNLNIDYVKSADFTTTIFIFNFFFCKHVDENKDIYI